MRTPRFHFLWLLPLVFLSLLSAARTLSRADATSDSLTDRAHQLWASPVHDAEFAALPQSFMHTTCAATQLPEALATPDPLLESSDRNTKIEVSFIVGTDGRVQSPLILESAGVSEDRAVLNVVRSWRYRPALCNGVPTEAEAKVEFSNR